jgi:hypothetical protein
LTFYFLEALHNFIFYFVFERCLKKSNLLQPPPESTNLIILVKLQTITGGGSISLAEYRRIYHIAEKTHQFHDFSYHCLFRRKKQYRRKCVGGWSFYLKLLWVRYEWRHILRLNFSNLLFWIFIWWRLVEGFFEWSLFYTFQSNSKILTLIKPKVKHLIKLNKTLQIMTSFRTSTRFLIQKTWRKNLRKTLLISLFLRKC